MKLFIALKKIFSFKQKFWLKIGFSVAFDLFLWVSAQLMYW
jgi:hypothetical protein